MGSNSVTMIMGQGIDAVPGNCVPSILYTTDLLLGLFCRVPTFGTCFISHISLRSCLHSRDLEL